MLPERVYILQAIRHSQNASLTGERAAYYFNIVSAGRGLSGIGEITLLRGG